MTEPIKQPPWWQILLLSLLPGLLGTIPILLQRVSEAGLSPEAKELLRGVQDAQTDSFVRCNSVIERVKFL